MMTLPDMAREFDAALRKQKSEVQTREIKQRTHISILLNIAQDSDPAAQAILQFIAKHTSP
jgi:hypothetical protein